MKTIIIFLTLFLTLFLFLTTSFATGHAKPLDKTEKTLEAPMDPLPMAHDGPIIKVQYGLGIGDVANGEVLNGSERNLNVGYYSKLNKVLGWGTHIGLLTANGVDSGYAFVQFGSVLHPFDWMYVDHYFGPGYVMKGNSKIAEGINFSMHIGIGWRDPVKGTTIGMNWKHISNAGIRNPNKGMDFILIQVGIPI